MLDIGWIELSVLVVDDQPICRDVLRVQMASMGCRVSTAEDGLAALEASRTEKFDVILMDFDMPNMDGWVATKAMRKDGFAGFIVGISADLGQARTKRALDAGMDRVVGKFLSRDEMRRLCAEVSMRVRVRRG